jgi:hypothetical protein
VKTTARPSDSNSDGIGGRAFQDRPSRRQVAEQGDEPALRLQRLLERPDHRAIDIGALIPREPLAERVSRYGEAVQVQQRPQLAQDRAQIPPAPNRSSM